MEHQRSGNKPSHILKSISTFLGATVLVAGAYTGAAKLGFLFALVNDSVTLIWPPAGIALAVMLIGGWRMLPGIVLGAFLANLSGGGAWIFPAATAMGNPAEACIGMWILTRVFHFRREMNRVRDVLSLSFAAAPIGAVIAATVGVSALWYTGEISGARYFYAWCHWWLGDVVGMIVITPVVVTLQAYGVPRNWSWRRVIEGGAIMVTAALSAFLLFSKTFTEWPVLSILVIPLLIFIAFRFSLREVALANLMVALGAVTGAGPVFLESQPDSLFRELLTLSTLLLVMGLTAQLLAIVNTARNRTEKALRESEVKHRMLFETANDAILLIHEDRVIACNARASLVFGEGREKITGACFSEYAAGHAGGKRWAREDILAKISSAFEEGAPSFEWEFFRRDGTSFLGEVSLSRLNLSGERLLQAIIRDITERKKADVALRQSEATIRSVFRAAPIGICILKDRILQSVNEYWCERLGYSEESLIGQSTRMLYETEEEWRRVGRVLYERLEEKGLASTEAKMRCRDGRLCDVILTTAPVDQENLAEGVVGIIYDITERKATEKALYENERKYRELVENANSIILRWDSDGKITFLNEFGQRFFGYSAEEILGRHVVGTITPSTESSGRDLKRLMEQICEDPKAFEQNINENIRCNGERVWVSWANRIRKDEQGRIREILSVGTDITAQKQTQDQLRRSEEQFRLIMENLADLVAVLDLDGRRLYSSPSYGGLLGAPNALFGTLSFEEIHPMDKDRVREAFLETVRTGVGHRLEYRLLDREGNSHDIESQGSVIRDVRGNVMQVVVVSRDVTERRKAEAAIRELNAGLERRVAERTAELAEARERAESADRLKSAFLAAMSHELRTPLNSIIGFTGIVLQGLAGPLNEEQAKQLGMVQGSARHLLALINDVLDLSKIEAGQLEVEEKIFDVRESLEKVTRLVSPMAEKKGLKLTVDVAPDVGELESDSRRFEQILINLINNGLKFTERGGVRIHCAILDHKLMTRVEDTGMGIKSEDIGTLFQAFHQIDVGLSRNHEGTGLGLSICKRLVEKMGGCIWVDSEWGVGSVFTFTIPIH